MFDAEISISPSCSWSYLFGTEKNLSSWSSCNAQSVYVTRQVGMGIPSATASRSCSLTFSESRLLTPRSFCSCLILCIGGTLEYRTSLIALRSLDQFSKGILITRELNTFGAGIARDLLQVVSGIHQRRSNQSN